MSWVVWWGVLDDSHPKQTHHATPDEVTPSHLSATKVVAVVLVQLVHPVHPVLLRVAPDAFEGVVCDAHAALSCCGAVGSNNVRELVLWQHGIGWDLLLFLLLVVWGVGGKELVVVVVTPVCVVVWQKLQTFE